MNRIDRIECLRDCGIFRNFMWPSDLPEFGRYNVIYGWNGTGKTTLSRLLRDLELTRVPTMGKALVNIAGNEMAGNNFPQSTLPIRVFNRDFIHENVFPFGGGDMPPIFVLGAENVKKQERVERLKEDRVTLRAQLGSAIAEEQSAQKEFDKFCRIRAKSIKDTLRTSGPGPYNNYNKATFRTDAEQLAGSNDCDSFFLTDTEHATLVRRHKGESKPKVAELSYVLPDLYAIRDYALELLTTTAASATLDILKRNSSLADWIHQGLTLHGDHKPDRCLFCDQQIPTERLKVLKEHFSTEYERLIQRIDQQIAQLKTASEESLAIKMPSATTLYSELISDFKSCEREIREALVSLREFLAAVVHALEHKKQHTFEKIKWELEVPLVDEDVVAKLNVVIDRHNQECDAFNTQVDEARQQLANHMIATELVKYLRLRDTADRATQKRQMRELDLQRLNNKITELEREIVEHRKPAEELNEDLQTYLGHCELCLEVKDTGYGITRGAASADTVSEGETTAIALLYFLKSLNDRRFNLEHGVVVLDDPVSSLDGNALFLAFAFIRERTGDAGQLFILTHNFSFFRQIRNWFLGLKGQRKRAVSDRPARFFMLSSKQRDNVRSSAIRKLDPLLKQYDSEYHYLFSRIYEAASGSAVQGLEEYYALPNVARRMLEAFLAFRKPQISGGLGQQMNAVPYDKAKKLRILRFLHTHSHNIPLGEAEHDLTALAEAPAVLKDLMEMIKSLDSEHFSAMQQLVEQSANSGRSVR